MDDQKNIEFMDEDLERVSGGKWGINGELTNVAEPAGPKRVIPHSWGDTDETVKEMETGNCQIYVKDAKIRPY